MLCCERAEVDMEVGILRALCRPQQPAEHRCSQATVFAAGTWGGVRFPGPWNLKGWPRQMEAQMFLPKWCLVKQWACNWNDRLWVSELIHRWGKGVPRLWPVCSDCLQAQEALLCLSYTGCTFLLPCSTHCWQETIFKCTFCFSNASWS